MIEGWVTCCIHFECCGQNESGECHSSIDLEQDWQADIFDEDFIHQFLEENGWLLVAGDEPWCPSCRYELHNKEEIINEIKNN